MTIVSANRGPRFGRLRSNLPVCFAACLLIFPTLALGQARERVMFGESIYVGPNEVLREVVCIGCSIHIEGRAREVVSLGGNVKVSGTTREVVALGGNIVVTGKTREVVAIGGNIDLRGETTAEVVAVGGNVRVSGSVGREVVAVFGNVALQDGASVRRDVVSVGGRVTGVEHAVIGGSVQAVRPFFPLLRLGFLVVLFGFLVAGLVVQPLLALVAFALLGDRRVWVLAETARQRAGMSFILGLGAVFAWFLLSAVSIVSPLWIPAFSFPFSLLFIALMVVGYTGISYWVGRSLLSGSRALSATLLGAVLITILQLIPVVGWMAFFVFSLMAIGAALLSGFGTSLDWMVKRGSTSVVQRTSP